MLCVYTIDIEWTRFGLNAVELELSPKLHAVERWFNPLGTEDPAGHLGRTE